MQKALFLGNGINLLTKGAKSWLNVLEELSRKVQQPNLVKLADYKPFTLIYEAICSRFFKGGNRNDSILKQHVADLLREMGHNIYHHNFLELGANHIITTNYDYCLEQSISPRVFHNNMSRETSFSLFRRTKSLSTQIWHIHGEIDYPKTIMLGHEQYGRYLRRLCDYLTSKNKKSPFMLGKQEFDDSDKYSWTDVFLRDEIHIIGSSLDYSEIDLWWLLSYKSRIQKTHKFTCGPTYYYHWTGKKENDRDKARIQLLESLGVKVKEKYGVKDFSKEYENFMAWYRE